MAIQTLAEPQRVTATHGKIVEELNKSLIRMVDALLQQRKERLPR
eukprot:gene2308-1950_t